MLSSSDHRQDIGYSNDASSKRDDKNVPSAPTTTTNSGPSSSNEANDLNLSSIRSSPRNLSDEDASTAHGSVPRTLPGNCLPEEILFTNNFLNLDQFNVFLLTLQSTICNILHVSRLDK